MKAESILQADLLDIIFENRNKNYGAYLLRKHYGHRVYKALMIVCVFLAVLSAFTLFHKNKAVITARDYVPDPFYAPSPLPEDKVPLPPRPPKVPGKKASSGIFSGPIVIKDSVAPADTITDPDSAVAGNGKHGGGLGVVIGGEGPQGPPEPRSDGPKVVTPAADKNIPVAAEIMPSYPGGMKALQHFLQKNLRNPEPLEERQVILVKIKFIVGYDGKLKGFETIEDGGEAFNKEVIRVLRKMPDWIPGKARGENVSVYYTIPVKFVAEE
jgi:protein TonB